MTGRRWSVVDRERILGFSGSTMDHWALGRRVADRYKELHGEPPGFGYKPKTNPEGAGTHHHAIYTDEDAAWIDDVIKAHYAWARRQQGLFE